MLYITYQSRIIFSLKKNEYPKGYLTQLQLFLKLYKRKDVTGTVIITYASIFVERIKNRTIVLFMSQDSKH